jgi:hypothetical protein
MGDTPASASIDPNGNDGKMVSEHSNCQAKDQSLIVAA